MGTAEAGSRLGGPLASNSWNAGPSWCFTGRESDRKREINRLGVLGSRRKRRRARTQPHATHTGHMWATSKQPLLTRPRASVQSVRRLPGYFLPLVTTGRDACETEGGDGQHRGEHSRVGVALGEPPRPRAGSQACSPAAHSHAVGSTAASWLR